MAKFYMGNQESADKGMWEALRALPDDYHVFIEFQIPDPQRQRQVDFLVIRESPDTGCLFLLEVKNERRRLRGTINGPWQYEEAPGAWMPLFTSNRQDQNPLQQAYNTAMVMKNWLLSMQALLQDPDDPWIDPYQTLTIFPRLVLPFSHRDNQLQIDRFTWRFDSFEESIDSLVKFMPREAFHMGRPEIERLAHHLGVKYLPEEPRPQAEGNGLNALRAEFRELGSQISLLRQEIQTLRTTLSRSPIAPPPPAPRFAPAHSGGSRSLDEVFEALGDVIRELRDTGRRRVFPNVHEGLIRRLGSFSPAAFGFQRFKDFMGEAERRGHIRIHTSGLNDYAFLPGENAAVLLNGAATDNGAATPNMVTLNRGDQISVKVLSLPLHTKWMDPWAELVGVNRGDTRVSLTQPSLNIQVVSTKEQRTLPLTSKMVHLIPSFDVPPEFREERFVLDDSQNWKHLKGSAVERFFLPEFVGMELDAEVVSITPTGNIVANCRALDLALMRAYEESKGGERSAAAPTPLTVHGNGGSAVAEIVMPESELVLPSTVATNGTGTGGHGVISLSTTIGELADEQPDVLDILAQHEAFSDLADELFLRRLRPRTLAQVATFFGVSSDEVIETLTRAAVPVE